MQRRSLLALAAGLAVAPPSLARAWPLPPQLRRLDLVNAHTGEIFKGPYRDDNGPIADALGELCHFLRDFHCGERTEIDIGVVDFLARYRTPTEEEGGRLWQHTIIPPKPP